MRRREAFSTSSSSASLPQPARRAPHSHSTRNMSPHRHSAPAIVTTPSQLSASAPSLNYEEDFDTQHHQNLSTPIQLHRNATIATSSPSHHHENTISMRSSNSSNNKRSNSISSSSSSSWLSGHNNRSNNSYYSHNFDDDNNTNNFLWWKIMICVVLAIIPWLPSQFEKRSRIADLKQEMDVLIKDQRSVVKDLEKLTESVKDIKFVNEVTLIDNDKLFQQLSSGNNNDITNNNNNNNRYKVPKQNLDNFNNANEEYLQEEDSEEGYLFRIDQLEKYIQEMSVKRIQKRYGLDPSTSGPLRVKVTLEENSSDTVITKTNTATNTWRQVEQDKRENYFIIELATLQEMPYSVDHFLKMVELKLWEGLSLTHSPSKSNGKGKNKNVDDSLLLASPSNPYTSSSDIIDVMIDYELYTWSQHKFQNANLTQMEFTEHSETYPPAHKSLKYSVSFRGRPGGPDWYINLSDDDYSHVMDLVEDDNNGSSPLPTPSSTPTSNPPPPSSYTTTKNKSSQYHHSHDSTFGFVVEGREVLDRFLKDKRRREKTRSKDGSDGQFLRFKTLEVIQ